MVRILNGEIVQDDDPRLRPSPQTQRSSPRISGVHQQPQAQRFGPADNNAQRQNPDVPPMLQSTNQRLLDMGLKTLSLGDNSIPPILYISLAIAVWFFGLQGLLIVIVVWFFLKGQRP